MHQMETYFNGLSWNEISTDTSGVISDMMEILRKNQARCPRGFSISAEFSFAQRHPAACSAGHWCGTSMSDLYGHAASLAPHAGSGCSTECVA